MASRLFPSLRPLMVVAFSLALAVVGVVPATAAPPDADAGTHPDGYLLLTGRAAAEFRLPADLRLVHSWHDARGGLRYERYQQFAVPLGVFVDGAQLTLVRRSGEVVLVIGAHYPRLRVSLLPQLDAARAIGRAALDDSLAEAIDHVPPDVIRRRAELRVSPDDGRLFYLVESGAPGAHLFHEVDAQTGAVIDAWNAIAHVNGMGTGTKGDRKSLLGANAAGSLDDLTTKVNGVWRMRSTDGDLVTYDARKAGSYGPGSGIQLMSDNANSAWANDNDWSAAYQRAAVDAQYYAALSERFLIDHLGFDLVDQCGLGAIRSVVHFDPYPWDGRGYDNAFWDGYDGYLVYGDGDGYYTSAFAGGQDVVTHELGHAVTQCRANLVYRDESGALNEAFSDILGTAAEWAAAEPATSNCRRVTGQSECPDWWIGEDVWLDRASVGFRSMADPGAAGQPAHYAERKHIGTEYDNGGVHVNSGIANHAFYLMAAGGRNARCAGAADTKADCDVIVPPIPLADAERIFFHAWGMLTANAQFCAARDATVAAAGVLFPGSVAHRAAAELAWAAVGRSAASCQPTGAFALGFSGRSLALAPGTSGQLQVKLTRGTQSGPIDFAVSGAGPAAVSLSPAQSNSPTTNDGTTLTIDVPADAPSGTYPLLVSATDGSITRHAAAVLVVDAEAPVGSVSRIAFTPAGTVSTAGLVPLQVTWSATDAGSGVAGAQLEHSADGTNWSPVPGTTGTRGTVALGVGAGTHHFRVLARDAVGNSATSTSAAWTLGEHQHPAARYTGTWSTYSTPTAWGTTRFSKAARATAKFTFNGTEVAWIAQRGPKRGKAKVFVDGVRTLVDLHAAGLSERRVVFSATNLAAGPHTLKIVVKGTSGRPRVDVDGFVVLGR